MTFAIGDRVVATSVVGVLAGTLGEVTRVRDDGAATVRWDGGATSYGLSAAHITLYRQIAVVTVRS